MTIYLVAMAVTAGIFAVMALGLNVTWGMAGQVNLGLVGFTAVGAYTSALLTVKTGIPIPLGMLAGAIAAGLVGIGLAVVTARLRGDYLAIVTLGFAEALRITISNEIWLTNGTDGISGIPGPFRDQLTALEFNVLYLGIVGSVVLVLFLLCQRLLYSPFGRVLHALRDDDVVASVAGKHVQLFKVKAFGLGSAIIGLGGALYAHYTSYIAPDLFVPLLTLYVKLSLLAGGVGNNRGALLGAVIVIFFLEITRFLVPYIPDISPVQGAALRELTVSVSLLVILRFRTKGLLPEAHDHLMFALPATAMPATATATSKRT
jgi:branched-chain amino acid transport system permease protein